VCGALEEKTIATREERHKKEKQHEEQLESNYKKREREEEQLQEVTLLQSSPSKPTMVVEV
jgi:hypothetical protein